MKRWDVSWTKVLWNIRKVRDKNGKALTENRYKVSRWVKYIESLYKGDAAADLLENENKMQSDDKGDSILKEEFEKALRGLEAN